MKPGYQALVALGIQSWTELPFAECFTLTLATGTVLRYTNYDVPVWLNGLYFAANAVRIDNLKFKQTTGLDIDQQEIDLIYSATDNVLGVPWGVAIRNHVLDGCYVQRDRAFFNPYTTWLDPLHGATAAGGVTLFRGRVADITAYGRTSAQINVKSDLVLLDIDYPRNIWQASCLHTLYDSGCGLSRGAYQGFGEVGSGATNVIIPYANGGTGGVINVSMSGTGGAAIAQVKLTSPDSINNTYTSAPPVTVSDPTGSGAVVVALLSRNITSGGARALYGFMVLEGGTGYTNPTISLPGGATAQAVLASGAQTVSGLSVGDGGTGYSQAAQLVFTGGGGTGAAGKLIISSAGVITGVIKTSSGMNYAGPPTPEIVDGAAENFSQGTLMFQGGQNAGTLVQIKSATPTALTLASPLQYVPAAGDVFSIWPGCDHTTGPGGCAKYDNIINFRGFKWVPPADNAF